MKQVTHSNQKLNQSRTPHSAQNFEPISLYTQPTYCQHTSWSENSLFSLNRKILFGPTRGDTCRGDWTPPMCHPDQTGDPHSTPLVGVDEGRSPFQPDKYGIHKLYGRFIYFKSCPPLVLYMIWIWIVHDIDLDSYGRDIFRIHNVKGRKEDRRIMYITHETFVILFKFFYIFILQRT